MERRSDRDVWRDIRIGTRKATVVRRRWQYIENEEYVDIGIQRGNMEEIFVQQVWLQTN